jgi:NitT/TauT family transport system substrate-binding protein
MKVSKWALVVGLLLLVWGAGTSLANAQTVRVGYLHTVAVDGQFWIAMEKGYFKEQGLNMEPIQFTSGIPLMQALAGGSLDVGIMGAVISNFPSRGMGKIFLINDIEYDTAMIFARPETKAKTVKDLKGQRIATVKGTTAHVFLHTALKANGLDSTKDVNVISMDMAGAVSAFISGAVPFVTTWAPFNVAIREKVPGAILISSAKEFYPQAAIVDGWVASNDYYAKNKETLKKIVRAWIKANDFLLTHTDEALKIIHSKAYPNIPFSDVEASYKAEKVETTKNWVKLYQDGTVARWVGQVERVFLEIGSFPNYVDPKQFFDPNIFLSVTTGS